MLRKNLTNQPTEKSDGKYIKIHWDKFVLIFILALTGFLSFYSISNEGYGNQYYAATVKSMLQSWHNFFFASFDPAGYVTVDKPAFGLWLQATSAFIFGFHGWSLILPEFLSTLISISVLFHLVKRYFGKVAGLISALVLGLTPILVAVTRTNNLDASLLMLLMLATWALVVAAEKGSFKYLVLSMMFVGLGFNVKMLQAFMILPALYLVYLFTAPLRAKIKIAHLAGATAVLMTVSLLWAVIVDLTPADSRPYIGSSSKNSVIELALGYNGIQRITGSQGNGGNSIMPQNNKTVNVNGNSNSANNDSTTATSNSSMQLPSNNDNTQNDATTNNSNTQVNQQNMNQQLPPSFQPGSNAQPPAGFQPPSGGQNPFQDGGNLNGMGSRGTFSGGPGGEGENGTKGVLRIFNEQLSGQITWFLPMAFFGALSLILSLTRKGKIKNRTTVGHSLENISSNNTIQEKSDTVINTSSEGIYELRFLLLWLGWIIPMLCYFSIAGFFHRYYLSMLAPGIAALTGIGLVHMWKSYMSYGLKWIFLPLSLGATAIIQGIILSRYSNWSSTLIPLVCGGTAIAAILLIVIRLLKKDNLTKTIKIAAATGFIMLMISPAIWSSTPLVYGSQTTLPIAGPELENGGAMGGRQINAGFNDGQNRNDSIDSNTTNSINKQSTSNSVSSTLIDYLTANKGNEKYLLAVPDAGTAEEIIIKTGLSVVAMGGFSGNDNILTLDKLKAMVNSGQIRYFMIGGRGMNSQSEISQWVMENGKLITLNSSTNNSSSNQSFGFMGDRANSYTIYDLKKNS